MVMQMPYQNDRVEHCETLESQEDLKMSTEPGATQTRYTTTQILSDHCDKAESQEEVSEQAPAKSRDTCAGSQIFHVAALNLLTGTAGNRSPEKLRQAQLNDEDVKPVLEWLEKSSHRPPWEEMAPHSDNTKVYCAQWQSLRLYNGVLYRLWETPSGDATVKQLKLLKSLMSEVLQQLHHTDTWELPRPVRERLYWVQCQQDVRERCHNCDLCAQK